MNKSSTYLLTIITITIIVISLLEWIDCSRRDGTFVRGIFLFKCIGDKYVP